MPFPTALKSLFSTYSVHSPLACFGANSNLSAHWKQAKGISLRYGVIVLGNLYVFLPRIHFVIRGFSPKVSGFYPWSNVEYPRRGWRRDCVVGGMETRFQWRKAHSRTAKCEAFHFAPRLFFYVFVFDSIDDSATMLNPSPSKFPTEPQKSSRGCYLGCWEKIILMLDYCSLERAAAMRVVASTMFSSLVA